jgi:hypothetical protein
MNKNLLDRIVDGRADLVFDYLAAGHSATASFIRQIIPPTITEAAGA